VQVTDRPSPVRVATWNLWWRFGPWQRRRDAIASEPRGAGARQPCCDARSTVATQALIPAGTGGV
jgi:hypothetical protein